jgi:hypothetical protein
MQVVTQHVIGRAVEENAMSRVEPTTYRPLQDGLRAAGHFLDANDRRLTSLLVVADGIVLTLMPRDLRGVDEALLLTHEDLRGLWAQCRRARSAAPVPGRDLQTHTPDPMFPTGYEDFLRALGAEAARQRWTALRLLRVGDDTILRYGTCSDRKEMVLAAHDIETILNRAFRQRGKGALS